MHKAEQQQAEVEKQQPLSEQKQDQYEIKKKIINRKKSQKIINGQSRVTI